MQDVVKFGWFAQVMLLDPHDLTLDSLSLHVSENLVKEVHFQIPVSTSTDVIPEVGIKYHIGANANSVEINEGVAIIK